MVKTLDIIQNELLSLLHNLSPALQRVARWLATNLPEAAWRNAAEIARLANTSESAVVRCVQAIGYDGFLDFQSAVRESLPPSSLVWRATRSGTFHPRNSITEILESEQNLIQRLRDMDWDPIHDLAAKLSQHRRIYISAHLMTIPMASHLALHLHLILPEVTFISSDDPHLGLILKSLTSDDLFLVMTFPRYSQISLDILEFLCVHDTCTTALITDISGPKLTQSPDILLQLPMVQESFFPSGTAIMILTQILVRLIRDANSEATLRHLKMVDSIWSSFKYFSH
ncbi:MurR/RpiR family transcriptional regulator [Sulfobacillus thermosulfidooxidans]|uniref:MurR/RpiR family transcriptional regulator n=1 Tax=Sulfobacillus thermosulfidooxidans TaxID=28034 RepID=UPI00040DF125|nr:MurR/RpiR family transcriptional regulator [Sulfobacillus thermosulfidooxidans]